MIPHEPRTDGRWRDRDTGTGTRGQGHRCGPAVPSPGSGRDPRVQPRDELRGTQKGTQKGTRGRVPAEEPAPGVLSPAGRLRHSAPSAWKRRKYFRCIVSVRSSPQPAAPGKVTGEGSGCPLPGSGPGAAEEKDPEKQNPITTSKGKSQLPQLPACGEWEGRQIPARSSFATSQCHLPARPQASLGRASSEGTAQHGPTGAATPIPRLWP